MIAHEFGQKEHNFLFPPTICQVTKGSPGVSSFCASIPRSIKSSSGFPLLLFEPQEKEAGAGEHDPPACLRSSPLPAGITIRILRHLVRDQTAGRWPRQGGVQGPTVLLYTDDTYLSHHPANSQQDKWWRKSFQINSISNIGAFIKINCLEDVYWREPWREGQRESRLAGGLYDCHLKAGGTSPRFKCASLPLSDRCFKPVTCFVRISFVRAAPASFVADANNRGELAFQFPAAVLGNGVGMFLHHCALP